MPPGGILQNYAFTVEYSYLVSARVTVATPGGRHCYKDMIGIMFTLSGFVSEVVFVSA